MYQNFIIEGIDRLGKSLLIEGIEHTFGYHVVLHYAKPKLLDSYKLIADGYAKMGWPQGEASTEKMAQQRMYQHDSFISMFEMLENESGGPYILDRAHLGEMVYGPMYRGYSGDYVLDLEDEFDLSGTRLILLIEDFTKSKHFSDDGQSLGPESARAKEQELFIEAFNQSSIVDKRIICVTADDGGFRSKEDILAEAVR